VRHPSPLSSQPTPRPTTSRPTAGARPGSRRTRLLLAGGVLALVGLAVIGLTLLLAPAPAPEASAGATAPPTATAAPTSAAPSRSASTTPTPSRAAVLDLSDRSAYQFASPTGNIICQMGPTGVRCDARDKSWTPPAPDGCTQAHDDLGIDANGRAGVVCATDTIRQPMKGSSIPTLGYGQAARMGDLMCFSQSNGISCSSNLTGDSIFLARERYEISTH